MSNNLTGELSLSSVSQLFKVKYGKRSENVYNSYNVLLGTVKKSYDFGGKQMEFPAPFGFQGGRSAGLLPEPNTADYRTVTLLRKKLYSVCRLDREAIKAALASETAFTQMTKEAISKTVEAWMANLSRILFGNGYGAAAGTASPAWGDLCAISSVVDNTGGNYSLTMSATNFKEAAIEERDFWNIGTGTELFLVQSLVPSTRVVVVQRQAGGAQVPVAADICYMQRSRNQEPAGLRGVCDATSGSIYGVTVGRRWRSTQVAAAGAGITPDLMNQVMIDVERRTGKVPNKIVTSYVQLQRILNQLEDLKRYSVQPRDTSLKGKILFEGVEFMSSNGPIPIFADRFCEDDRLYALNTDFIELRHAPDFGWFNDDVSGEGGAGFLRVQDADSYEARYGGYLEVYIAPPFQGVITGLAT